MNGPIASSWMCVNGPRADCGERRQAWLSEPKARAHWEDSSSSLAPCWPSGDTTRDCTLLGSTGRKVSLSRSRWSNPISSSSEKGAAQLSVLGDARIRGGEAALGDDLLEQLRGL